MATTTTNEIFETIAGIFNDDSYHGIMCDNWDNDDDEQNGLSLTISVDDNGDNLRWQSGDNSFTGDCYSNPHWAVITLHPELDESGLRELATDVADQLNKLLKEGIEIQ
jgi:hypothetical protein